MDASISSAPTRKVNLKVLLAAAAVAGPLIVVLVLNIGRDPHAIRSPLVGRQAPAFSLPPVGGGAPVSLDSLRGTPVVLNFWATWCLPCIEEQAALTAAAKAWPQVRFVGVVYEDEEANARQFVAERGGAYPSLVDAEGKVAIAYGVFGVPETFFIDADGRIVEKFVGPLDKGTLAALVRRTEGSP